MRLPSSIPFSVFGGIWLMLVFSQPVSSAPTEVSKRYVPTQSVLDVFQNVTVSVPPVDKRQLDPTQLRRVAFLAQRMNANPKPITDYSTPCNGEMISSTPHYKSILMLKLVIRGHLLMRYGCRRELCRWWVYH